MPLDHGPSELGNSAVVAASSPGLEGSADSVQRDFGETAVPSAAARGSAGDRRDVLIIGSIFLCLTFWLIISSNILITLLNQLHTEFPHDLTVPTHRLTFCLVCYESPDLVLLHVTGITQMLNEITKRLTEITQRLTEVAQKICVTTCCPPVSLSCLAGALREL